VRRIVVVLLVVLLVGGCGGSGKESASTGTTARRTSPPATPAGFTVRPVRDEGFSIAVPSEWQSLDASTALRGPAIKRFKRENPAAAGAVVALARPNSPMKFVAVDPGGGDFATNVNVVVSRIPADASFETWTRAETAQIAPLQPTHLTKRSVRLRAGKAYRLAYRARLTIRGRPRELALHQYMVKRGPLLYVITFTTAAERDPRLTPTFERSARTFRLTT
jgi:hypothetical protein